MCIEAIAASRLLARCAADGTTGLLEPVLRADLRLTDIDPYSGAVMAAIAAQLRAGGAR